MRLRNDPKCTQTLCNAPKPKFRVQWGGLGAFVEKNPDVTLWQKFCINCTSSHCFAPSFMQLRNDNGWTQTQWNLWKYELGSNGVDWVCSLRKIPTWLRGMNFGINCTSSPYFASSFMELRNDPKCTQTLYNAPKHEFWVQWGGLGAFVAKNPNVTSWDKLFN